MRRLTFIVLMLAVFACTSRHANAAELPSVDALRAKIAAAAGERPVSSEKRVRYTAFGLQGTETTLQSGGDVREIDVNGPIHTENGRYQRQAWHQNANGQTVLEQPQPGKAADETFTTIVRRVSVPFDAFVLSRLNAAGSGTKDYVDAATYRIVRQERILPTETTVYAYDDFRVVAGYTSAWHWTRRDGHVENDGDYRIETFVARPVAKAEIDVPPPRRAVVEFPAGKTSVDLPVRMVGNSFIVRVTVAGRGLDFELDTGASGITLEDDIAKQLGFQPIRRFSNSANAGRFSGATIVVPEMKVGDLHMRDVVLSTMPALPDRANDMKIVGLLGFDFIAELALRLDYENGRVTAMTAEQPVVRSESNAVTLDIRVGTQRPLTDVTINGALGESFTVDTGAGGALMIADYFARRYPKALVDRGGGGALRSLRLAGVGGAIDARPYQLAEVKLGNVVFRDFVGYRVMERKSYETSEDGLIGAELLRYFTVWLEYGNSQIILLPNSAARSAAR